MDYPTLKLIHVSCVTLSAIGFLLRGVSALYDARRARHAAVRATAHTIDTVLLASALAMAWQLGPSAWSMPWLQAKLGLLILYIGLGFVAMSQRPALRVRVLAFGLACLTYLAIVASALSKLPLGLSI